MANQQLFINVFLILYFLFGIYHRIYIYTVFLLAYTEKNGTKLTGW